MEMQKLPKITTIPEINLWHAVLFRAAKDALNKSTRDDVIEWMKTQDFKEVCRLSGVSPEAFKRGIRLSLSK